MKRIKHDKKTISRIEDPNISGTINLYTERDTCQSYTNIIFEF